MNNKIKRKPNGYWTYDKVWETALKYFTRSEFSEGNKPAYSKAIRSGWIDDVTKHMTSIKRKPKNYWTYDRVEEEAKKYNRISEFRKGSESAYGKAFRSGWLDDVTKHMVQVIKPRGYWTYDRVEEEAKKYNTRSEFKRANRSAYNRAYKNGWIDDVTKHYVKTK
jgi:hypothetical protein